MAAVSCLPSHGSSSDVSCCPPLKGMDSDDRSSSSISGSTDGNPGGLVQRVSDLMFFDCRCSSVLPHHEAKDVRSICSGVDAAAVVPKGSDQDTNSSSFSSPALKESTMPDDAYLLPSGPSADSMIKDSRGSVAISPTSDAFRSSFGLSGSARCHPRSGSPFPLVAILMMFIFILDFHTATAAEACVNLKYNATQEDLLTCQFSEIKFEKENGNFPIIDLSNFSQKNFSDFITVKPNAAKTRVFIGNLRITNSVLDAITIELESLDDTPQFFEMKSNLFLEEVKITNDKVAKGQIHFNIRGNKILSTSSLGAMKALNFLTNDSYIQDFGECIGTDSASFKDLEGCHYISGDLTFSQDATNDLPNFPSTLTEVRGCIIIQNTSLTNVDFIKGIKTSCPSKNVVRDNRNLCIYSQKARKLEIEMKNFIFEDNSDCEDICTWNWALANRRNPFVQCAVIQGDVNINGSQFGKEYEMLYTVKMIMGQLMIHENSFENFTIFKRLLKVDSTDSTKPAIHIYDNPNMKLLELPMLREITRPASDVPLLVVEDNHEDLQFSKRQHTRLSKLGKIEIPIGEPVTTMVATTTRVRATTSSSSRSSLVCHASLWMLIYVLLR